jgi:DNA-binding protein H-NS
MARKFDLEAMSTDDLWSLHEQISEILAARIAEEKRELEKRLAVLNRGKDVVQGRDSSQSITSIGKARRKYPRVFPKYRNPQTSETWSGRGKQPRWLVAALKTGRKVEDFEIGRSDDRKSRRQHG